MGTGVHKTGGQPFFCAALSGVFDGKLHGHLRTLSRNNPFPLMKLYRTGKNSRTLGNGHYFLLRLQRSLSFIKKIVYVVYVVYVVFYRRIQLENTAV